MVKNNKADKLKKSSTSKLAKKIKTERRKHVNKRQGEIYRYARKEYYKEKQLANFQQFPAEVQTRQDKENFLNYLAEAGVRSQKLKKEEHNRVLKETARLYREEIEQEKSRLRYLKDQVGDFSDKLNFNRKGKFKHFWLEKGEHKEFRQRKLKLKETLKNLRQEYKGKRIANRQELIKIYEKIYRDSPWRIRDRFLITTNQSSEERSIREIFDLANNKTFPHHKKHYLKAIVDFNRKFKSEGIKVSQKEIVLNKYGWPQLNLGQVMRLGSDKPGKGWEIYKEVPSLKERLKEIHTEAHRNYIEDYGTEKEKYAFYKNEKRGLCRIESNGGNCLNSVETSDPYCLYCISHGKYHPPILPTHCDFLYKSRPKVCGNVRFHGATDQYHYSESGEATFTALNDWGSCHVGRTSKNKHHKRR